MPRALLANNISTTLSAAISSTAATTFTVTSATGMPAPTGGTYFYCTLLDSANVPEIVKVTGVSGTTLTCVRAQDGTAARTFLSGGTVKINLTAAVMAELATAGANTDITSLSAITSINGGQLAGLRNRIINGDMRFDQRNNGAVVAPISQYTVDRWLYACTPAATKMSVQQVVDAPPGFVYSSKITVTTQYTPAVGEGFSISQQIEGTNIVDIQFGLSSAQTITISMWVKSSVAGTYSVSVRNGAATRSYVGTINVTTSWARQSITLIADVTGTWAKDNTSGLILALDLGSGSNFNTTAGSWVAGNFVRTSGSSNFVSQVAGSTINITGVQLEVGLVATPFEQRPYGMERALCERYYTNIFGTSMASKSLYTNYCLAVPMRTTPSFTLLAGSFGGADFSVSDSRNYRCPTGTVATATIDWYVGLNAEL